MYKRQIRALTKNKADKPAASPPVDNSSTYTGVKLIGVDEKTAEVIMAITADNLGENPDNLKFISIREVK